MSFNLIHMGLYSPENHIDHQWICDSLGLSGEWGQKMYLTLLNSIRNYANCIAPQSPKSQRTPKSSTLDGSPYEQWYQDLAPYYPPVELTHELFAKHALLYSIVIAILSKITTTHFARLQKYLPIPPYFAWITADNEVSGVLNELKVFIADFSLEPEDLFAEIYQDIFINSTRHIQGEFYTNEVLCELMVNESYQWGNKVLDPTCGSGTFLLMVAKKILESSHSREEKVSALKKLYGVDCNPLACLMTQANLQNLISFYQMKLFLFPIFHRNGLEIIPQDLSLEMHDKVIIEHEARPKINGRRDEENKSASEVAKKQSKIRPDEDNLKWDLVIGNPPWLVLNGIPSQTVQARIKSLGKELNIIRGGKFATSTEITTIFWQKMVRDFLKPSGIIHFVVPAGIASGDQHALFRRFDKVSGVEIWDFDFDFFRIHSLCLKAHKMSEQMNNISDQPFVESYNHLTPYPKIRWKKLHWDAPKKKLVFESTEEYIPIIIEHNTNSKQSTIPFTNTARAPTYQMKNSLVLIGRFAPKTQLEALFGRSSSLNLSMKSQSPYKNLFRQGASLVPRNLIFVDIHESKSPDKATQKAESMDLVQISPAESLQSKKDSTWNFKAYDSVPIERKYLFKVAKSTGLLSFYYYQFYNVVLPLERLDVQNTNPLNSAKITLPNAPYARKHFQKLIRQYSQNIKSGAKITHLFDRLNYGRALTDPKQYKVPKVIFAGIGSNVKAAIIRQPAVIDTSLYFYVPKSIGEAYYLIGILNSDFIISFARLAGSTGANGSLRNIHKTPLKLPIPTFNAAHEVHSQISSAAMEIEMYVEKFISKSLEKDPGLETKVKSLQNKLLIDPIYRLKLIELTQWVQNLIGNNLM